MDVNSAADQLQNASNATDVTGDGKNNGNIDTEEEEDNEQEDTENTEDGGGMQAAYSITDLLDELDDGGASVQKQDLLDQALTQQGSEYSLERKVNPEEIQGVYSLERGMTDGEKGVYSLERDVKARESNSERDGSNAEGNYLEASDFVPDLKESIDADNSCHSEEQKDTICHDKFSDSGEVTMDNDLYGNFETKNVDQSPKGTSFLESGETTVDNEIYAGNADYVTSAEVREIKRSSPTKETSPSSQTSKLTSDISGRFHLSGTEYQDQQEVISNSTEENPDKLSTSPKKDTQTKKKKVPTATLR